MKREHDSKLKLIQEENSKVQLEISKVEEHLARNGPTQEQLKLKEEQQVAEQKRQQELEAKKNQQDEKFKEFKKKERQQML